MILITRLAIAAAIVSVVVGCGSSRINSDISNHEALIARSRTGSEVVVSMDTVYRAGNPYAVLKVGGISGLAETYTFYTLTGDKAIEVMPDKSGADGTSKHRYQFFGNSAGMAGYDDFSFSTISVVETVVNNDLMNATGLRSVDVGNFVRRYPKPAPFNAAKLKARREMTGEIKVKQDINSGVITQGRDQIGTFDYGTISTETQQLTHSYFAIKFNNGTKMATVRMPWNKQEREQKRQMEIETEFDGKIHTLQLSEDAAKWEIDVLKEATKWLVDNGYL